MQQSGGADIFAELMTTGGGATVIDSAGDWHAYVGASADENRGVLVHTGHRVDLTGATFATANSGASTRISGVTHNVEVGDFITITGCSDTAQNGIAQVEVVDSPTDLTIDIAFSSDPGTEGFLRHGDHFEIAGDGGGTYSVSISLSGSIGTSSSTVDYAIIVNKTVKHFIERKYQNINDKGAVPLTGIISVSGGDEIWLALRNDDNSNDNTINELSFTLHKIS